MCFCATCAKKPRNVACCGAFDGEYQLKLLFSVGDSDGLDANVSALGRVGGHNAVGAAGPCLRVIVVAARGEAGVAAGGVEGAVA